MRPTEARTHPVAAVQPLLHDADELLVAELVVTVLVEDLEDRVDKVVRQVDAGGHVDGAGELLWGRAGGGPEEKQSIWHYRKKT